MSVKDLLFSVLQTQQDPAFILGIEDGLNLSSAKVVWDNAALSKLLSNAYGTKKTQSPLCFLNADAADLVQNGLVEKQAGPIRLKNALSMQDTAQNALWYDLEVTYLPPESGEDTHVYGRFVDVTEREQLRACAQATQAEAETAKARFHHAVSSIPEGFAMYDRDDILVAFNAKYADLYKHSAPAIKVGATFEAIMRYGLEHGQYPEAEGQEEAWLAERLDRENRKRAPVERALPDGKFLRIQEVENEHGDLVGLRSDVTQYYEQQQELEQKAADLAKANEEAEAASLSKDRFFARMSHELRTPMNGILGLTEVLEHTALNPQQRSYLKTISGSATSLLSIINDILDYSKATEGKFTFANERFSLKDTIYEAAGLIQPLAHDKNLDFWIEYPHTVPTHFFGDSARVRQVLLNHLGNALKFTENGHLGLRATYQTIDGEAQLSLSIVDTGRGIPDDQMGTLFAAYEQTHQDTEAAVEGTGLGLAISKALVEQMGGAIDVASTLGEGSCFTVSLALPACPVSRQKAQNRQPPTRQREVAIVGPVTESTKVLTRSLETLNCRVVAFEDAERLLLETDQFQAVIWDGDHVDCFGPSAKQVLDRAAGPCAHALMVSTPLRYASAETDAADYSATWLKPVRSEEIEQLLFPERPSDFGLNRDNACAASAKPCQSSSGNGRVLVVDDNKTNRLVAGKLLETVGVMVDFASNGLEALDVYKALRPTTIFMDVAMPVMDGVDATAHIRKLETDLGLAPCKIFALTANTHKSQVDLCLSAGVDGVIGKPVKRNDLIEAINFPSPRTFSDLGREVPGTFGVSGLQDTKHLPIHERC
ncbi:ATP-binding protein [Shimia sp. MIT1388]|uniref:ATP-binding protein n=1 Tax=Shimia sp. MIT1388 TaxID=3096992 RepID=UPI003999FCEC